MEYSIDHYQNIISLLKQALIFYANKDNYVGIFTMNPISLDNGSQAQFALDSIKDLEDMYKDLKIEYYSVSKNVDDEISKLIDGFKNINNEGN